MGKYLQVFKISLAQEFSYRVNFVMWRVRNIIQIFLVFFLWDTVFSNTSRELFGYDRSRILTYIFGLLIVKSLVLSTRSIDVAGDISRGDISNYLLKPVNYFKYWLTRDFSSKVLNLIFAFFETVLLFVILKPPFYLQTNPITLLAFVVTLVIAIFIYFTIVFITSSVPFWIPEAAWGVHFILTAIFVEFLSGALFPLDILPQILQKIVYMTPFPYLIFFPIEIYLGKISGFILLKGIGISFLWAVFLWIALKIIWNKGLKVYQAYGK
jgi:ABC-2 type transport system permease protein